MEAAISSSLSHPNIVQVMVLLLAAACNSNSTKSVDKMVQPQEF
jgi:hypothetical protein